MQNRWQIRQYWRKKEKKICSLQFESDSWKAIEVNDKVELNVDEQQDNIKHLKDQCDRDNEDDIQDMTAAITP